MEKDMNNAAGPEPDQLDWAEKLAAGEVLLAEKDKELDDLKDRLLRTQAEFANYRQRNQKEKEELFAYASAELLLQLLPVLDNLDLAMNSLAEQNEEIQHTFVGLKMIAKQFREVLAKAGLQSIVAVGTDFDPRLHEAVQQVPATDGISHNQVVEEIRKGYSFKDKVLRAAMVKVAQNE